MLDRVRQPEYVGFRYIGRSGLLYCSVYCAEQGSDTWENLTDGWIWDPQAAEV